jgi:flagellar motor switch protein FliM
MDVVKRLLSAARVKPPGEAPQAEEYDFSRPCVLTAGQARRIADLAADAAAAMSCNLSSLLGAEITVKVGGVAQEYAGAVMEGAGEAAAITAGERPVGFSTIESKLGGRWVARLLGGTDVPEGRELSALERTLLADVLASAVKAVSVEVARAGGPELHVEPEIRPASEALSVASHEPLCRLTFGVSEGGEGTENGQAIEIILLADAVDAAVASGSREPRPVEQVRQDIRHWLEEVRLPAFAAMRTRAPMGHLLSVEPGDVLLTERGADDPMELIVNGRPHSLGTPVACEGQYALQIVTGAK